MRKAGAYRSSLANCSRRSASRSGGRSICVCAGRSRVSSSNAASSSRGIPRPRSFNTWPPTSRLSATLSMKWPRPIACAGRWASSFKEWKSYANLHAFDTQNPAIVEGLIWAAISAAALKRFLAHTAQVVTGVETSTRKVAMCAVHFLHDILRALISEIENRFLGTFARAIDYLAGNARRAHPKRDRQRGRLQFGLEPIFANP